MVINKAQKSTQELNTWKYDGARIAKLCEKSTIMQIA